MKNYKQHIKKLLKIYNNNLKIKKLRAMNNKKFLISKMKQRRAKFNKRLSNYKKKIMNNLKSYYYINNKNINSIVHNK